MNYQAVSNGEFGKWFATLQTESTVNCFVFPYSGAGVALFASWKQLFAEKNVGLFACKLPGREERLQEPLRTDLVLLAKEIAQAILTSGAVHRPVVLVGFSMGALLAFEVARELRKLGVKIALLFAGAARAPNGRWPRGKLHRLKNDDDFICQLNKLYNAIPQAVIADSSARQVLLPIIRADLSLFETYKYLPETPLDCELITLAGTEDTVVQAKHIAPWRSLATRYRHRSFSGDHYFAKTNRDSVVNTILRRVSRLSSGH